MDFGIARILDENVDGLTRTEQGVGTWGPYMPPEGQAEKPWASERSDVYQIGVLLRHVLTFDPCGNLLKLRPDCPQAWRDLINRSQFPLEDQRLPSVAALHQLLRDGLNEWTAIRDGKESNFRHDRARQLAAQHDYAGAVAELEKLAPGQREANLFRDLTQKRDRIVVLGQQVRVRQEAGQRDAWTRLLAEEWVHLQPNRDDVRKWRDGLPREFVNSIGMKLALIPPGRFLMGSPDTEANREACEGPLHEVEITRPFFMGVYPVTQAEYQKVMGSNPSHFGNNATHPVEQVSWDDAMAFCKKLSEIAEEKREKRLYTLPAEAQWEYSCRGGVTSPFHMGDSLSSTQANFNGQHPYGGAPAGPYLERTSPAGSYKIANAFGLYDMHGNVWEWCLDWFDDNYYATSPDKDPTGPTTGTHRVLRGGAWGSHRQLCRAASRIWYEPGNRFDDLGFRVVLLPT